MPLQNRVDPFGVLRAVPERGLLMGNRGIIHDPETKTLLKKRWALQAWIICVCEFRDVRREPMGRNRDGGKTGWTELFFLDEVTALSAGHRPCFFCRRERASDFVQRFGVAYGIAEPRAPQVDKRLHKERLAAGGRAPVVSAEELAALPDGAMIAEGGNAYAMRGGKPLRWSFAGYGDPVRFGGFADRPIRLLTPATAVSVLRQGYEPVWHASAEA
ncbi:MAG: hypothetical protein EOQ42_01585 [Mesorhizobium sp.]|uniref:hypothetical protein n=1 Tax=unclassified Mesorhizobium TaxID=325217 RepID=UPI000FE46F51|nr:MULTISPECIES: hypothetical protein [unclassified Mesorhizobium]RWB29538.1 MAG: hypothetical protein EOQ43_19095 [Mesorhizobium sp.]RWB82268.1 MAG: hypothetical protein EOQ42_01585 [Mesorhizobium sp.]RWC13205.1 MAG: hypothetical protein EOS51_20855 [Mesorhizobium sp.]RWD15687.1 MAG: hypothetical protein EOS57_20045 [Mesorhizobium sp.]RWF49408.1 MAG: hypothetical protein EOS50_30865 [Mesorhizobium sp.]